MLLDRIKDQFDQLTPAQKKAAHYIQNNIEKAASMTAREIGAQSGCSEPTIHRLAKVLGFQNYQELSNSLREKAVEKRMMRRFNTLVDQDKSVQENWVDEHRAIEIANIEETLKEINGAKITAAARMILGADRIYVAGWRAGLSVTSFLSYLLQYILGNAQLIPQGSAAEYANYISEKDVLIVTGFPRYCKTTMKVCEAARRNGARIIAFTDSELSPFHALADMTFLARTDSRGMLDSYVAPLTLCNLIVNEVAYQQPDKVRRNIGSMEKSMTQFDLEYTWK